MRDEIFFIPIIAQALQQPDPGQAMREAFGRIRTMGKESRYSQGYKQFLRFMDSVDNSQLMDEPEQFGAKILEELDRPGTIEAFVERDGDPVGSFSFGESGDFTGSQTIANITPGQYRITLETGRVLWEGSLDQQDVLWSKAWPGESFKMAADSGKPSAQPVRVIDLLDGTLIVRVYAGLEAGFMQISSGTPEAGG